MDKRVGVGVNNDGGGGGGFYHQFFKLKTISIIRGQNQILENCSTHTNSRRCKMVRERKNIYINFGYTIIIIIIIKVMAHDQLAD